MQRHLPDFSGGLVTSRSVGDVVIFEVGCVVDDDLVCSLKGDLSTLPGPWSGAVVDLTHSTLLDAGAVHGVVDLVADRFDAIALATERLSARALLRRWGVTGRAVVFHSAGDALQARTAALAGYGPGWSLS